MLEGYYNSYAENFGGEEHRLKADKSHIIEFRTSLFYMLKYLPEHCTVLDCCAGAGIYAFELAAKGYRVTAGDLIKCHVDAINNHNNRNILTDVFQGDVLDMSRFSEGSFDAVVCMGALYHLQSECERNQCVSECLRVLKSGGIFIFSYINRFAVYINHFNKKPYDIQEHNKVLNGGENGVFYGMNFEEPDNLVKNHPVEKLTNIGVDGLMYLLDNKINSLNEDQFEKYMKINIKTCEQPSLIGNSMHGLWIGRKK